MSVNWFEVQKALQPIKDYEDLTRRWQKSFSYAFTREKFNPSMAGLAEYTRLSLGGDPRHRYDGYAANLVDTFLALEGTNVPCLTELLARVARREDLASFSDGTSLPAPGIARALKFLIYWFIPGEKLLTGLVRNDPAASGAIEVLRGMGVRTNLDLLEQGRTASGRRSLARNSAMPLETITSLVHRADLSRMPWASKATISNIIGAGYGSLAALAGADPEKLLADFFRYGHSIGKNLKLGNEIENSQRIARIVPVILEGGD